MEPNQWTPPPVAAVQGTEVPRRRRGLLVGAGLLGAGAVAGAIIGGTVISGAATTSPTPAPGSTSSTAPAPCDGRGMGMHPGRALGLSGTVTAVGSSSVTIKTSTATTEYKVDSNSDIDKFGEAKLSDLKVGDAVRFSVTSAKVIDKLHAGNEAMNRQWGPPPGSGSGG